jgi:HAMP domain-containing protein
MSTRRWRRQTPEGRARRNLTRYNNYHKTTGAMRTYELWTPDEEQQALAQSDYALAKQLHRSVQSIQAKRNKLKREANAKEKAH